MGYLTGRTLADQNLQWPYKQEFPRGYKDQGRQILTLERREENFCQRCAWVHGRPIFHRFAGEDCLFARSDRKAGAKQKKKRKMSPAEVPVDDGEDGENGEDSDGGGSEEAKQDDFEGTGEADLLPHFHDATDSVAKGELVVVTGIQGEGHPYHVAQVQAQWPPSLRGREGRTRKVELAYYGHRESGEYTPSWKKPGELKEKLAATKPMGHRAHEVSIPAAEIIIAGVELDADHELNREVMFTLTKWVVSLED